MYITHILALSDMEVGIQQLQSLKSRQKNGRNKRDAHSYYSMSLKRHFNCFLPVKVAVPEGRDHHYSWQLKVFLWLEEDLALSPSFSEPAGIWTPFRQNISIGPAEAVVYAAETVLLACMPLLGPDERPFLLLILKLADKYLCIF